MKVLKLGAVALSIVVAAAGFSSAPAAPTLQVERFGNLFAVSVCGRISAPGSAHCFAKVVTDARGDIREVQPRRGATAQATPPSSGLGPADLRDAYKITGTGSNTFTIAIVDAYGYPNAESDLAYYRSAYGLPPCTTANNCFRKVDQRGGTNYPRFDLGWAQETALDLQMASAICPGCKILLVEADTNSFANITTAVNRAATLGAKAISHSYGGPESGTSSYESAYNKPGIAQTVSSGDNGYGVEFPAASPHVTAVGGTSLRRASNARGWTETVWTGSGSGCSAVYGKPTWQTDPLCANRTVADVSAVADPNTGVAVYGPISRTRRGWMIFGGTSASAPIIAGVYGVNGTTTNFGSDPYNAVKTNATALFDVTSGSNGSCGGTYLCTGTSGYDGPTGLGTPNGATAF